MKLSIEGIASNDVARFESILGSLPIIFESTILQACFTASIWSMQPCVQSTTNITRLFSFFVIEISFFNIVRPCFSCGVFRILRSRISFNLLKLWVLSLILKISPEFLISVSYHHLEYEISAIFKTLAFESFTLLFSFEIVKFRF